MTGRGQKESFEALLMPVADKSAATHPSGDNMTVSGIGKLGRGDAAESIN
jgi:hypothetical protein